MRRSQICLNVMATGSSGSSSTRQCSRRIKHCKTIQTSQTSQPHAHAKVPLQVKPGWPNKPRAMRRVKPGTCGKKSCFQLVRVQRQGVFKPCLLQTITQAILQSGKMLVTGPRSPLAR